MPIHKLPRASTHIAMHGGDGPQPSAACYSLGGGTGTPSPATHSTCTQEDKG